VRYKAGGVEKKAKVDGLVYGQFKAEEGAPAERLFQRILQNFSGELIGYAGEEEGEAPEDSAVAGGAAGAKVAVEEDGKAPGPG
ncbi:MAG: hypothetical protein GWO24_06120, partial [Akkermansiaceae bacterium]|nr:hypothetical protein [Akkermansiaceae bacterium]